MATFTGLHVFEKTLRLRGSGVVAAAKRALFEEGHIEMTEAKRRCPVDTGALRGSGFVSEPVDQNGRITVTLGFGGAAAGYAVPVHERLDVHHPRGQAKFLESVMKESAGALEQRLGARIRALSQA